jgi:hypothetical protein
MRKDFNRFLLLIFSMIPGAGYMYLGLMRRGLEAMLLFVLGIVVPVWIDIPGMVAVIIVPLWFYCLFDTYLQRNNIENGIEVEDQGFLNVLTNLGAKMYYWVGLILIVIGVLALLNNLTGDLMSLSMAFSYVRKYLPAIFLIVVGLILLRRRPEQEESNPVKAKPENIAEIDEDSSESEEISK